MLFDKTILAVGAATIVNPTNADADASAQHTRGLRAESLASESRDVHAHVSIDDITAFKESLLHTNTKDRGDKSMANTTSAVDDDIFSRINPAFMDDVVKFTQSSLPTHDSIHGCVEPKDDLELASIINLSNDGQVHLCPGTIHFYDEIYLSKSVTISCVGPKDSCILDGNGMTRHFVSLDEGPLTLVFTGLSFINGLVNADSSFPGFGGSMLFFGDFNPLILDGCLFYNNRVTSPASFAVGGAIFLQGAKEGAKAVFNNCLFLDNVAVATAAGNQGSGGAIYLITTGSNDELKVVDSVFKNNRALSLVDTFGTGGAIFAFYAPCFLGLQDVLVLNSVFEMNEASGFGGAFYSDASSVSWYNNKELLFGNDADVDCDGLFLLVKGCVDVGENFFI